MTGRSNTDRKLRSSTLMRLTRYNMFQDIYMTCELHSIDLCSVTKPVSIHTQGEYHCFAQCLCFYKTK